MITQTACARLIAAQRLLLDAHSALLAYEPTPAIVSIADDMLREAMAELGLVRNELREPPPQVSPGTF